MNQPESSGYEGGAGASPVRRVHFSSRDEDEVTEFIRTMCVGNRARLSESADDARFEMTTVVTSGVTGDRHRSTVDYSVAADPFDHYLFVAANGGCLRLRSRDHETAIRRGGTLVYPLGVPFTFDMIDLDIDMLRLPSSRLEQVAEETTGLPGAHLRFQDVTPVSSAMRDPWRATAHLAQSMLMAEESPMAHPLLAEEMTRTVAVVALHTFPNTAMVHTPATDSGLVGPAALRRAVAYIEDNAQHPVTLSDIAAAAGTRPRALQAAFRRHHHTRPWRICAGYVSAMPTTRSKPPTPLVVTP